MSALTDFLEKFPSCKLPQGEVKQLGKSYYLISPTLKATIESIPEQPRSAGLFLGEEKNGTLAPSANLLALLKDHDVWIQLDQKTAWLFVCGRDVFAKSIAKQSKKIQGNVVVKNEQGEVLGLGKKKENLFKNIVDIGYFLRKEK